MDLSSRRRPAGECSELNISKEQLAELQKLREKAISEAFSSGFKLGFRPSAPTPEELKKSAAETKARQEKTMQQALEILTK